MKILIAPHDDDAELFAAFTCLRERPLVVVCTDSIIQQSRGLPVDAAQRHLESLGALAELWVKPVFLNIPDTLPVIQMQNAAVDKLAKLYADLGVTEVWAPAFAHGGHDHHNSIAVAAGIVSPHLIKRRYLTYANGRKQTDGEKVMPDVGDYIARKLRALTHHRSQMNLDPRMGCWSHFLGGLEEYYER